MAAGRSSEVFGIWSCGFRTREAQPGGVYSSRSCLLTGGAPSFYVCVFDSARRFGSFSNFSVCVCVAGWVCSCVFFRESRVDFYVFVCHGMVLVRRHGPRAGCRGYVCGVGVISKCREAGRGCCCCCCCCDSVATEVDATVLPLK
mgnify:CR=1 FL=1